MADKENKISFSGTFGEKVGKVNAFLKEYEPHNWGKDHKSYSGYKPQWIIDAVNTEFCGDWSMEVLSQEVRIVESKDKKTEQDKQTEHALVRIKITLGGQSIEAFASHPNVQGDIGDTFKSAQTDAMKKAFAHFSIGNRAYHGLLK
jgi:recombination DNA repair RAD52 pathway protein